MSDSWGVAHPGRWFFGVGTLFVLSACGARTLGEADGSGGAGADGTGGVTSSGGRHATGGVPLGGKGARPSTGGVVGTGGAVGTGGTSLCQTPRSFCSGVCVDVLSDDAHCGSCFGACSSNTSCVNGFCQQKMTPCPANTVFCSNFGECLDTNSNPFACGSCLTGCPGTLCVHGVCDPNSCVSPTAKFCKSSSKCTELSNDYLNCGACDHACGPADSCVNGKCVPPQCDQSTYCPNAGCTDTTSDPDNCGACDRQCNPGPNFGNYAYACNQGKCGCVFSANKCGSACTTDFWYCPPDGFTGKPADLCLQTAHNSYETCACKACLPQIQACFGSATCMSAMDCTLPNPCPTCPGVFTSCTDNKGAQDPLAEKLVECMNAQCSKP